MESIDTFEGIPTVYVLKGTTGEYSDRAEWVTGVFRTEEKAKERLEQLVLWAKVRGVYPSGGYLKRRNDLNLELMTLDYGFSRLMFPNIDYTGVNWFIEEGKFYETT